MSPDVVRLPAVAHRNGDTLTQFFVLAIITALTIQFARDPELRAGALVLVPVGIAVAVVLMPPSTWIEPTAGVLVTRRQGRPERRLTLGRGSNAVLEPDARYASVLRMEPAGGGSSVVVPLLHVSSDSDGSMDPYHLRLLADVLITTSVGPRARWCTAYAPRRTTSSSTSRSPTPRSRADASASTPPDSRAQRTANRTSPPRLAARTSGARCPAR